MSDYDENIVDSSSTEAKQDAVPTNDNDDMKTCGDDDKTNVRRMRTAKRHHKGATQDQSLIWTVADIVISTVSFTFNTFLNFIGLERIESERQRRVRAMSKSFSKRKRCEKLKSETNNGQGLDDDVGEDHEDDEVLEDASYDEDENDMELEMKRWRPDGVFMAVERFISRMWGEKDSNENIKENDNDENMNSFASTPENADDGNWSKKPNINFVSDSFVSDINDVQDKGIHGTSTPCIVLNDNTADADTNGSKVFVFSAEKSGQEGEDNDDASMSTLTFEQKQAYFTEQIKVQSAEALKGISKTPDKLTAAARTVN